MSPEELERVEKELAFISRTAENAARKTLRHFIRFSAAAWVSLVVALGGVLAIDSHHTSDARNAIVASGRTVSVSGCNRDYRSAVALRALIRNNRPLIRQYEAEGLLTPKQADRARANINQQLRKLPAPDCRLAVKVVTDDPEDLTKLPPLKPLYHVRKKG